MPNHDGATVNEKTVTCNCGLEFPIEPHPEPGHIESPAWEAHVKEERAKALRYGLDIKTYNIAYTKGWEASSRGSSLDEAEVRFLSRNKVKWNSPEHNAWEDGWLDMAVGREKYHLRDCRAHHNDEGGCMIA
jgi:hypothetical protein